jgi:glycerophosphoryl diester phosphodiesterase
MLTIAHRGAASLAKDNTLEAFQLALSHGTDMIETDLRLTADGLFVLSHLPFVWKGLFPRRIATLSYHEVQEIAPENITVQQLLQNVPRDLSIMLELRLDTRATYVRNLVETVASHQCIFSSVYTSRLSFIRSLLPNGDFCLILGPRMIMPRYIPPPWIRSCIVNYYVASGSVVQMLKREGLRIFLSHVESLKQAQRALALKVDGVLTGDPCLVRRAKVGGPESCECAR